MLEELQKTVGKKALFKAISGLAFEVKIKNVKIEYGNKRYQIVPIKGTGEKWVENVEIIETNKKK